MSGRLGNDIVDLARTRLKQRYVFGAKVPKNNPNWQGPWDCAEFVSWCVFQAYGLAFGLRPRRADRGDAYSGYWYEDAGEPGVGIAWEDALKIPGAILVRRPRPKLVGHVSISVGDGAHTIEARGAKFGVDEFGGAHERPWDIGVLLPGVDYDGVGEPGDVEHEPDFDPPPQKIPKNFFALQSPHLAGPPVLAIQHAAAGLGYDPGPFDGDFGPLTEAAIASFQASEGLELDGIVGPQTAGALGLGFPIVPSPAITNEWNGLVSKSKQPAPPPRDHGPPGGGGTRTIDRFVKKGSKYYAAFKDGTTIFIGSEVSYSDDMHRIGLYQDRSLSEIKDIGVYRPSDHLAAHGPWAHFIAPTIAGESAGYFGRVNSYDRAAFTFGGPQFAAHTPDLNLIVLMRRLLALPSARNYFPELSLKNGKVALHRPGAETVDLETETVFTRPNGKQEKQLRAFMEYLNPDPASVGSEELSAAARLMLWTKDDSAARDAQIATLIERARSLLATAKRKTPNFKGDDWRSAIWVFDILYQGRGGYSAINIALDANDPLEALSQIGGSYVERRKTIRAEIAKLDASGVLAGFAV